MKRGIIVETKSALEIKDLRKSFGSKNVLNGVNIEVYRGEIIGYIGPNGAGKSTTVKLILGLLEDYDGEIKVLGENIKNSDGSYKKRIGYVPEVADVYESLTAKEYLTFIGQLYGMEYDDIDKKAKELMEVFNVGESYNSRLSNFSKGMKQKVMIIASILHNPDILFWDEPLSGLDANIIMIVKELLEELASKGKTIFYSSHIMDVVEKISDRIILINEGTVIADGTFEELKLQINEGSLENIFNELTGFSMHKETAKKIISIVEGEV
ncbi:MULTISPECIES: ABC transporter ATP-binding protein [Clostridium]|uniref:ABC transporter ATP-binding protein n=1 Tax=Clostridium senegalense TaxID=1465809 RepID=A0A6M0H651_9CLOT|nr:MULTISPECIES: ABC transporter ATP-binding protein [Clostridium]NEU06017.1 ABC transporter ATP-binding protein [Clostridium senegalense]